MQTKHLKHILDTWGIYHYNRTIYFYRFDLKNANNKEKCFTSVCLLPF